MALIFLVLAVFLVLYFYATRKFDYWRKRGIPFEKPVPFLGNIPLPLFRKCFGTYLKAVYETFGGPLVGFFLFDEPQLVIRDPEITKQILIKDFQHFSNRTLTMNEKDDPIGSHMLFVVLNPKWKAIRYRVSPAFSTGKLRLMFPLMAEVSVDMVNHLGKSNAMPLEAKQLGLKYSTDVITSCAFGVKGSCLENNDSEFFKAAIKIFGFTWSRGVQMTCYFISPFLVNLFKMKFLHPYSAKFLRSIFWDVVNLRMQSGVKRNDLIDILLEIKEGVEEPGLKFEGDICVAQAAQFFVAGYETSGSTACFTFYELSLNVDVQNRLREEIFEIRKKYNGITYDAVKEMKYLEMVVCETLRKYPVLPFLDRRAQIDYKIPGTNITIDKGTGVFIPVMGLHYDPQYFPDPHKYDPERFTPEKRAATPSCVYLPFGDGPRNCIGQRFGTFSAKMSVISTVSDFEILTTENTPMSVDFDPRGFLLSPTVPIPLRFKRLNTTT